MTPLAACALTPALVLAAAWLVPGRGPRAWAGALAPLGLIGWGLASGPALSPGERLLVGSLWLLWTLKGTVLLRLPREEVRSASLAGLALYATLWPGMDPAPLLRPGEPDRAAAAWFPRGWAFMLAGLAAVAATALAAPNLPDPALGWLGIAALLTAVHLGYSDVLGALLRLGGFRVHRLFESPLEAVSLDDFWSRRWNRPFVEMNHLLFLGPMRRALGSRGALAGAFVVSGLVHEFALSWPSGGGHGGPLLYFCLQAAGVFLERRWMRGCPALLRRMWTWAWLLAPLPLLFHVPIRTVLVAPLFHPLHLVIDPGRIVPLALTAAGLGHFLVLAASFQVPTRLGWVEELPRLRPLNRKLMWTYGAFIVLVIVAFGMLTLALREEMLRGDRAAVFLCLFIGMWWTARIVVDTCVFEHADWPEGPAFVVGHTLLTTLFVFLAAVYLGLAAWHLG